MLPCTHHVSSPLTFQFSPPPIWRTVLTKDTYKGNNPNSSISQIAKFSKNIHFLLFLHVYFCMNLWLWWMYTCSFVIFFCHFSSFISHQFIIRIFLISTITRSINLPDRIKFSISGRVNNPALLAFTIHGSVNIPENPAFTPTWSIKKT